MGVVAAIALAAACTPSSDCNRRFDGTRVCRTVSPTAPTPTTIVEPPLSPPSLVTTAASVIGGASIRATYTPRQPRDYPRALPLLTSAGAVRVDYFVDRSVTLAAGASSITFDVPTDRVTVMTLVTLTVNDGGELTSVDLQLLPLPPAQLVALRVGPARVPGGVNAAGLVTLSAAAPPAGTVVTLAASLRDAEVPATVTIAPGATTGTFLIVTRPPYVDTTVTITATVQNESRTATLVVETVPPRALDDRATIDAQLTLSVPAPGVLSNDLSPSGRPLTAELVRSVAHGTMIFEANGAFSYQPTREFSGTDTFTYTVYDGPVRGNTALVEIIVIPAPVLPTPVAQTPVAPATGAIIRLVMAGSDDFGDVEVGSCLNGTMKIFNDGDAALTWTSITRTLPTDFSIISGGNGTLAAGAGFAAVTVRFCPTALGARSSTLSVVSNKASGTSTKVVRGTGLLGIAGVPVLLPARRRSGP
jgi:hypothetical protein